MFSVGVGESAEFLFLRQSEKRLFVGGMLFYIFLPIEVKKFLNRLVI